MFIKMVAQNLISFASNNRYISNTSSLWYIISQNLVGEKEKA